MSGHTLARSTRTLEMMQVVELNARLEALDAAGGAAPLLTAEQLGLTGAEVHPRVVDRAAAEVIPQQRRAADVLTLPGKALLRGMLAAGAPSYPYLYGIFADPGAGRQQLPVVLHTRHLTMISETLQLRGHRWGI